MKLLRYPILIGIFCLFSSVSSLSTEKADAFWSKTSISAMNQIVVLYPAAPNLDALLTSLTGGNAASFAVINVAALPGAPASTGVVASDIQLVLNKMAPGFPDLGAATSIILAQIGYSSLPGNPPSSSIIMTDLLQLKIKVKPALFDAFGQVVTDVSAKIQLPHQSSLDVGITNVNTLLGSPPTDAFSKTTNILARLNAISHSPGGFFIAHDATNYISLDAWLTARGF